MLTQALVTEAIGGALQSERLLPSALAELQERKWHELARYAAARSPFYRKAVSVHRPGTRRPEARPASP